MLIPQGYADVVLDHAKCVDVRLGWAGSLAIQEDTCLFNFAMEIQTGNAENQWLNYWCFFLLISLN